MQSYNYRMAEKFLYNFLYTRYEIEKLSQQIKFIDLDVHAQNYNNDSHSSNISDPVADLFMKRERLLYQINSRNKIISQVNNFLDNLRMESRLYPDGVLIIELIYFCKVKTHDVAKKLNISVRTLYQRKKEIIKFFAETLQES